MRTHTLTIITALRARIFFIAHSLAFGSESHLQYLDYVWFAFTVVPDPSSPDRYKTQEQCKNMMRTKLHALIRLNSTLSNGYAYFYKKVYIYLT